MSLMTRLCVKQRSVEVYKKASKHIYSSGRPNTKLSVKSALAAYFSAGAGGVGKYKWVVAACFNRRLTRSAQIYADYAYYRTAA